MKTFDQCTESEQAVISRELLQEFSLVPVTHLIDMIGSMESDRYQDLLHTSEYYVEMLERAYEDEDAGETHTDAIQFVDNFEPYEWYGVDATFARRLIEKGEVVCRLSNEYYWARNESGQSIYMDLNVREIMKEIHDSRANTQEANSCN